MILCGNQLRQIYQQPENNVQ